jgi:hypothetical protein
LQKFFGSFFQKKTASIWVRGIAGTPFVMALCHGAPGRSLILCTVAAARGSKVSFLKKRNKELLLLANL